MRILYSSNAFWAKSGYGVQGASLLPRLAELPEINGRDNIAQFAWYGSQGGIHIVDGFRVYPAGRDPYGNDIIGSHSKHFGADIVITLIDVWVQKGTGQKVKPALWLPWFPVDHMPVPDHVLDALEDAYQPITYSKFGLRELNKFGVKALYIPHGIETNIYKVLPEEKVQQFKNELLNFDGHLSLFVGANKDFPDRKAITAQLIAFAKFAKDKPDVKIYMHTEPTPMYGGVNIPKLIQRLDIADKVIFPDRYEYFIGQPSELLAYMYNAGNVLLEASMSEGFGIPIIEAQACGTPVITQNFSAMPELIRYGKITEPSHLFFTQQESFWAYPDSNQIQDALEENYQTWLDNGKQKDLEAGQKASNEIHAEFNWDTITEQYWSPLMEDLYKVVNKSNAGKISL